MNPDEPVTLSSGSLELNRQNTHTIDRTGGTFPHTSRVDPGHVTPARLPAHLREVSDVQAAPDGRIDCTQHVLRVLDWLGVYVLVPIGGDDTLSYAERLSVEHVAVVGIPKTMDNDVYGTDYCLGFSTAVTRSVQFIHQLRTSAGSHEPIAIIELFGRQSGETTLLAAYLAGADRALIPEVPFDHQRLPELLLRDQRNNPSNYAIVAIGEGAFPLGEVAVESGMEDAYGHRKLGRVGRLTGETLSQLTADVFEELEPEEQVEFLESRSNADAAAVLARMAPDDAVDLLSELDQQRRATVLDLVPQPHARKLPTLLQYHPATPAA